MKKMDLSQKITCNTVAKAFKHAATKMSCYETTFCKQRLNSKLCASIGEEDKTVICQGTPNRPVQAHHRLASSV